MPVAAPAWRSGRAGRLAAASIVAGLSLLAVSFYGQRLIPVQQQQQRPCHGSQGDVKAAFVYMLGPNSITHLRESLEALYENFRREFPYQVLIFVPDDVPGHQVEELNTTTSQDVLAGVEFVPLYNFTLAPEGIQSWDPSMGGYVPPSFFPGYANMCRFFFHEIFRHPRMQDLEFYARLDSDSRIITRIRYDIFKFMRKHNYVYAYTALQHEGPPYIRYLWNFVTEFLEEHQDTNAELNGLLEKIPPPESWHNTTLKGCYYNNFELASIKAFQAPEIAEFDEAVFATQNIYRFRWGDAPLRWLQVQLFMRAAAQTHMLNDFGYQHGHVERGDKVDIVTVQSRVFYDDVWFK